MAGGIQWVSGRPGDAPRPYAGTDFIICPDGPDCSRLSFFFFDKL